MGFTMPQTPTDNDRVMAVVTSTEGGHYDAINMYDRMIVSVGLIQFGEAGIYAVSDMLGRAMQQDPTLLAPLQPALDQAGATFQQNDKGRFRFFQNGHEVDTIAEQQTLFLKNSNGLKGTWDDASKAYAKLWAASIANVFQQTGAQRAQINFTASRLQGFVTSSAKDILWAPGDPPGFPSGGIGALRAAYISFAANLPAVASTQLKTALAQTPNPKWSEAWCVAILKQLTFGPNIMIYPKRYNDIRPVIEQLFGVNMPDFAQDLKDWHQANDIDPTTGPGMSPTFTSTTDIQTELIAEGYDLDPMGADGVMGVKTQTAIRTFQGLHGLQADGIVGPRTRQAFIAEWEKRA
jgi:hypothetical protein